MRRAIVLLALVVLTLPVSAQAPAPARPAVTAQDMEALLLKGRISNRRSAAGVTDAFRVTLSDGRLTHDAQVQNVDIYRAMFDVAPGKSEVNFRDSYRYNIAAYRLARLLGLTNVPMSVSRRVDSKPSAVTWWIDDVAMDEAGRQKLLPAQRDGPNPARTKAYIDILRVFDELIQNRDRNSGNLLWTKDWTMWMIDHTRSFRNGPALENPQLLERCERGLLAALRGLTRPALASAVGDSLVRLELDMVLVRRDLLVKLFDERIAKLSETAVLYSFP